ncbi:PDC sensor domain-containing protein [Leucobacter musarum]|uniref:PDC sensor domain-containing protein n=1 Tax=Leucobacter musarum TaxID=1930747 RepID=UPI0006A7EA11|nr:cache domain-containing protein [Leucobacter musarum]
MTAAPDTAEAPLQSALQCVDDFFDGVFAPLDTWLPRLVSALRRRREDDAHLTGAQLAVLVEDGAHKVLDTVDRPLYGAGFCASSDLVTEGNPLAWWQGRDRSLLASSTFGPGQAAIDLMRLEWYRVPEATGDRHVAGPFVDYLCSNEITITSAVPVLVDGDFWGVVCADVLVSSLEDALMPVLAGRSGTTLVNANGRVVLSNNPDFETGDRYAGADPESGLAGLVHTGVGPQIVSSRRYPFSLVAA